MNRIPCRRNDQHQTVPVMELIKNGVQKGSDGKYHVNSNLPKRIRNIAHPPTNLLGLVVFITFVAAALYVWKFFDPTDWAKVPLSIFAEVVSSYAPWVFAAGAVGSFLLWRFWRPGHLQTLKERQEGVYCYGCDEIFFPK